MSGFFGRAIGLLNDSGAAAALPGLLNQVVGSGQGTPGGGLPALVEQLRAGGLGENVRSWIGGGENLPVTAQQIAAAIPPEQIESWAQRLGIPAEAVPAIMAHVLPHAVDQATPDGTMPDAEAPAPAPNFGSLVGRLFGGA
jgi:uncharacterized protein YidB (DUF937 family)